MTGPLHKELQSVPGALSHTFIAPLRAEERPWVQLWHCTGCGLLVERFIAHACPADGKSA